MIGPKHLAAAVAVIVLSIIAAPFIKERVNMAYPGPNYRYSDLWEKMRDAALAL